jgi:cytochrome b6-f complex iron-sulfur subunit
MDLENQKQSRRKFLQNMGIIGAVIVAVMAFAREIFFYLYPNVKKASYHKYLVGKEGEIPVGKAKEIKLGRMPVFVVHLQDSYRVYSGVCTHLGCIIRWEEENSRFYCPCHKGIFDTRGKVISGPPPRPLDEFEVKVEDNLVFMYVQNKTRGPWA